MKTARKQERPAPKLPAIVMTAALIAALSGCGGDSGQTTVTIERTVTVTTSQPGSTPEEKQAYTLTITDLTRRADQVNTDYRSLIDRYNSGQSKAEDLMAKADEDWRVYEGMSGQLTEMKVPAEFQEPHRLLISGFNKWQSTFEAYRDGFRDNNNDALNKARDLDNQAVIEVNQAVNQITQVQ